MATKINKNQIDWTQEAWTAPAFQNAWANYDGYAPAGYYKDNEGVVHLRGLLKNGTISAYPGVPMFTLPAGYRPAYRCLFGVIANGFMGRVDVDTNGQVIALSPSTNQWVQLDGITFRAEL